MQDFVNLFCITIASHFSNLKRLPYFIECMDSLLKQTIVISVYISVSFDNNEIKEEFIKILEKNGYLNHNFIHFLIQNNKTSQMYHYYNLLNTVKIKHDWIMFCDDDDSYKEDRVENIIKSILFIQNNHISCEQTFAGLYETDCNKDHKEHRHEYWCYCINKNIMERFYETLVEYPDIINNKCCDILFGEYMRRMNNNYIFGRLNMKLYNYRITENQESVTGFIQSNRHAYNRNVPHPLIGEPSLPDYILDFNECLYKNIDVYLHDVFLKTIVGCDIDSIIKSEFPIDHDLMDFVDECHLNKIKELYNYLRMVCNMIYDQKLL
jgi:hypothetical protein